jgi:hypothetical protein
VGDETRPSIGPRKHLPGPGLIGDPLIHVRILTDKEEPPIGPDERSFDQVASRMLDIGEPNPRVAREPQNLRGGERIIKDVVVQQGAHHTLLSGGKLVFHENGGSRLDRDSPGFKHDRGVVDRSIWFDDSLRF